MRAKQAMKTPAFLLRIVIAALVACVFVACLAACQTGGGAGEDAGDGSGDNSGAVGGGEVPYPTADPTADPSATQGEGGQGEGEEAPVYGPLNSASYSRSGDMVGSLYDVEAMRADDDSIVVVVREAAMHSDPIVVREYRAPDDLLDRIEAIVDDAGMKDWGDLPMSEFIALDAATTTLRLAFDPASPENWPEWISASFDEELPDGGAEAINAIHELMLSCVTDENLIREYTEQN